MCTCSCRTVAADFNILKQLHWQVTFHQLVKGQRRHSPGCKQRTVNIHELSHCHKFRLPLPINYVQNIFKICFSQPTSSKSKRQRNQLMWGTDTSNILRSPSPTNWRCVRLAPTPYMYALTLTLWITAVRCTNHSFIKHTALNHAWVPWQLRWWTSRSKGSDAACTPESVRKYEFAAMSPCIKSHLGI